MAQGTFLFSKRTRKIPRLPCRGRAVVAGDAEAMVRVVHGKGDTERRSGGVRGWSRSTWGPRTVLRLRGSVTRRVTDVSQGLSGCESREPRRGRPRAGGGVPYRPRDPWRVLDMGEGHSMGTEAPTATSGATGTPKSVHRWRGSEQRPRVLLHLSG